MRKFRQQKENAVNALKASIRVGDVDEGIIPLLGAINALEEFYTTSSCAGRISLLQDLGGKGVNRFLGKWHRKVTAEEVMEALDSGCKGTVWFMYEPPIIHVAAKTVGEADRFMRKSREAGFKRSGIQSAKEGRVMMEVLDTERIDAPVMKDGMMLVADGYVEFLVKMANVKLGKSQAKISKLEKLL